MSKYDFKRPTFAFWNVVLTFLALMLLTACGGTPTTTKPTVPTPTPTPTPTPEVFTKTYEGNGFSLKYPQDWILTEQADRTKFESPDQKATFVITAQPNPNEAVSADEIKAHMLEGLLDPGVKEVQVEPTRSINNRTWHQAAAEDTPDSAKAGNAKYIILVTNYPEKSVDTIAYLVVYGAEQEVFDEQETTNLKPMLESLELGK